MFGEMLNQHFCHFVLGATEIPAARMKKVDFLLTSSGD
jgi:hypothetical protein